MLTPFSTPSRRFAAGLWRSSPPLTATGIAMLVLAVPLMVVYVIDPREVGGVSAWLKPIKFALSTGIYSLTLAWVIGCLPGWPRLTRTTAWTTAVVFVVEVALIGLQAWRGVGSHFNVATPFDAAVFATMGVAIFVLWAASIGITVALFRQRFEDRALGHAVRVGMLLAVIGSGVGGLMTTPTDAQLARARATGVMPLSGAHTIGAADGGPGLPGTGWSLEHGDLRVPHFVGLHAVQGLPLLALVLRRRGASRSRERLVAVAGVSYAALFVILLVQALGGQPLVRPEGSVALMWLVWVVATAAAAWAGGHRRADRSAAQRETVAG